MRQDFIILRNDIKLFLKYNSAREIMKGEPRRLPKQGISGEYEASVVTSGRFSKRARNRFIHICNVRPRWTICNCMHEGIRERYRGEDEDTCAYTTRG